MEIVEHCRHRKDRYGGRVRQRDWLHRVLRGHEGDPRCPESGPSSERSTLETGHQLEPSSSHRRSPLDQIEGAVERWCQGKSTPLFSSLYSLWRT